MKGKTVDPKLYIIMRQDLYDNTAGKMMAQAAHAGTKFVFDFYDNNPSAAEFLNEWRGNRGFGTKIVLQGTLTEIMKAKDIMNEHDVFCGLVKDPTYPFRNSFGEYFTADEITCMYVFITEDSPKEAQECMRRFQLHP